MTNYVHYFHNKKIINLFGATSYFTTVGPFQTTGGWWIPLYPDMRKMYTKPGNIQTVARELARIIRQRRIKSDVIVGCATAGIPIATALALLLQKPFLYVRKEPKKGGLGQAVEGNVLGIKKGSRALIIDDATANGTSKKKFVKNVRAAGFTVTDLMVVAHRGSPGADRWTRSLRVRLWSMCSLDEIMTAQHQHRLISAEGLQLMRWYVRYPNYWHQDRAKWVYFRTYLKKHRKGSTRV